MPRVAVSLGASLGDRTRTFALAWAWLRALPDTTPRTASRIYVTSPVGGVARAPFLNAVVTLDTTLDPHDLRARMAAAEARLGRRPARRWADRVLDLDLLLYGSVVLDSPTLIVPHPRLAERPFLLAMLYEAWPDAPWPDRPGRDRLPVDPPLAAVGVLPRTVRPPARARAAVAPRRAPV